MENELRNLMCGFVGAMEAAWTDGTVSEVAESYREQILRILDKDCSEIKRMKSENLDWRAMVQTAADDLQKLACGLDVWDNQRNGNGKLTGPELSPGSAVAGTYGLAAVLREIADPKKGGE